jgi:hypothetical protein
MKLMQKLAIATSGLAMFVATVGAKPSLAADFFLSGNFNGILESSSPFLESLATFDGTYSVSGLPVDSQTDLTSWDINLRDTSGDVVFNFNNSTESSSAFIAPQDTLSQLRFASGLNELFLSFPGNFDGTGTSDGGAFINTLPPGTIGFTSGRLIESATSQPVSRRRVPEPHALGALLLASSGVFLLKNKVTRSQKSTPSLES